MSKKPNAVVKNLKKGPKAGDAVPYDQLYGNNGRHFEREFSKAYYVNTGKGKDLPNEDIEIKSRKNGSSSYHSVGTMTIEDIIKTPYEQSIIYEKFQRQVRVHYDNTRRIVTNSRVYDFTDPLIQDKVKEAYEKARQVFIDGYEGDWVRKSNWGLFERKRGYNSYTFRIPDKAMREFETISSNSRTFKNLFE
jgi:hypothetical protein